MPAGVLLLPAPSLISKWMSLELPLKLCKESTLSEQSMLLVPEEVTSVSADKSRLSGNAMLKDAYCSSLAPSFVERTRTSRSSSSVEL